MESAGETIMTYNNCSQLPIRVHLGSIYRDG
jgi:hypothetical protein